jgi:hypothetical protein
MRARLALVACVLWLLGVEGMPALHQATHDWLAPHRHDHGSIVTVSFEDTTHRHADGTLHVAAPPLGTPPRAVPPAEPDAPDGRDGEPTASRGSDHADGLAHHAAALAPPPPLITRPLPIDRRPSSLVVVRTVELVTRDPLAATARGPPTIA